MTGAMTRPEIDPRAEIGGVVLATLSEMGRVTCTSV